VAICVFLRKSSYSGKKIVAASGGSPGGNMRVPGGSANVFDLCRFLSNFNAIKSNGINVVMKDLLFTKSQEIGWIFVGVRKPFPVGRAAGSTVFDRKK
jgi:hypothetical protein